MSERFQQLFEESQIQTQLKPGTLLKGTIVDITSDNVIVNAGLKSEGVIALEEFKNLNGELEVEVGDVVDVVLEAVENGYGETHLSREKAKRAEAWGELAIAYEGQKIVMGLISGRVKGGFTVDLMGIRAFLPASLVDVRPIRDTSFLEGKELEFKIIKMDPKRSNIVVSRRSVVEEETSSEREALLEALEEGQEVKGIVKNLTDYGAFIDLGGIDGLLHITDMAWKRVKHPSEIVKVGEETLVKILKFDKEKTRVSLGLKQLGEDPWVDITHRYPENTRLHGRVTNLADYGCFVEIEEGVEGLVHVSEMDWTNKNIHPSKVVQVGDEMEVMVLDIDEERRRISLGIKQCKDNPWDSFAKNFEKGNKINGKIKSITDFGIFIGLDGSIDGLVHLSDISWELPGEEAVRNFKKGQEIEAVVLSVDADKERISLGIKQLDEDPYGNYMSENGKGSLVKGKVTEIEPKRVLVELAEKVNGYIRIQDLSDDRVEDPNTVVKVGEEIEARVLTLDRKSRTIQLSIKTIVEEVTEKEHCEERIKTATLGDLLIEKIGSKDDKEKDDKDE